jgi:hypothetical protein
MEELMTKRLLLLAVSTLAVGLPLANAQQDAGKPYGARDPHTCASRKAPAKGAPSSAQAAEYFTCDSEAITGLKQLNQVADVKVEVAPKGRPFSILTEPYADIDPDKPVYNIRGSFILQFCVALDGSIVKPGKNCQALDETNATGICYMSTFGDWHCHMQDSGAWAHIRQGVPPLK